MENFYQNNKEYYERNAQQYEKASWYYFNAYKNNEVKRELRICLGKLRHLPEIRILEIGPGTGYLLHKIVEIGKKNLTYTGVDHSQKMSEILKGRHAGNFSQFTLINETVTAATLNKLFPPNSFDLVLGSSILTHLLDYEEVVKTLLGLLKPGGVAYFVREPLHQDEVVPAGWWSDKMEAFYRSVYGLLMKKRIRKLLWPGKVQAEDVTNVAPHMFAQGITTRVFREAAANGDFSILFHRKYNRRATAFMSYLENMWLKKLRKDIFKNTLFSIGLQKKIGA